MLPRIDTRPLAVIILARWWRFPLYLLLGLYLYRTYQQTPPPGLSIEGYRALAVFLTSLTLWVFHLLPLPITGLFAIVAPALMGIMSAKQAFSFFGSEPVFFIVGVFILAAALLKSGLSSRLALMILRRSGSSPKKLLFLVLGTSAFLSFFMSAHAVAAMMFTLLVMIARSLDRHPHGSSLKPPLFLSMAWGCVLGSGMTMLGGGRVPLGMGILKEATNHSLTFTQWTVGVFPMVLLLLPLAYLVILRSYPIQIPSIAEAKEAIQGGIHERGRMRFEEKFLLLLTLGALSAWMFVGTRVGMATIAILVVVLLFMFKVVEWKDLEKNVEWGIVLMYGGAIGLSSILSSTGAANWLVATYLSLYLKTPFLLIAALSLASILLTQSVSNSAVIAVLVPVGISVANSLGVDPAVVVFSICFPGGLAFSLPMGAPAMALACSTGHLRFKRLFLPALIMILASWGIFLLVAKFWWPLVGIRIS